MKHAAKSRSLRILDRIAAPSKPHRPATPRRPTPTNLRVLILLLFLPPLTLLPFVAVDVIKRELLPLLDPPDCKERQAVPQDVVLVPQHREDPTIRLAAMVHEPRRPRARLPINLQYVLLGHVLAARELVQPEQVPPAAGQVGAPGGLLGAEHLPDVRVDEPPRLERLLRAQAPAAAPGAEDVERDAAAALHLARLARGPARAARVALVDGVPAVEVRRHQQLRSRQCRPQRRG
jgi:hypothetical protein